MFLEGIRSLPIDCTRDCAKLTPGYDRAWIQLLSFKGFALVVETHEPLKYYAQDSQG